MVESPRGSPNFIPMTVLVAWSLDTEHPVYQPLTNIAHGYIIRGTDFPEGLQTTTVEFKTTRIIFPYLNPGENVVITGFGFDKETRILRIPSERKTVEIITDSFGGEFAMNGNIDAGRQDIYGTDLTNAKRAILDWAWLLGEKTAADRRIIAVDGK